MHHKQIATLFEVWNGADVSMLDSVASPDVVRRGPAVAEQAHNLSELKQVITNLRTAVPDTKLH